jgi:hypothetical protein
MVLVLRRRVPGSARLGWTPNLTVLVPLGALRPGGGPAPRTLLLLQRRLPLLWWEEGSDGSRARRTRRAKAASDRRCGGALQQARTPHARACLTLAMPLLHSLTARQ